MSKKRRRLYPPNHFPIIPGFDLDAGPEGMDDPNRVERARRLGSLRWDKNREDLPAHLQQEKLDREYLNYIGRAVGPAARSGEDLPPLRHGQFQLAAFCYKHTTHRECWSFRAYIGKSRIRYSICDECDPDGFDEPRPALLTSKELPTLGKLIWMLDNSDLSAGFTGLYFITLTDQIENGRHPSLVLDDIKVHSEFYPQLPLWYEKAVQFWAEEVAAGDNDYYIVDSIELMKRNSHKLQQAE